MGPFFGSNLRAVSAPNAGLKFYPRTAPVDMGHFGTCNMVAKLALVIW
jgi:hypothetical protein